MEQETQVQS